MLVSVLGCRPLLGLEEDGDGIVCPPARTLDGTEVFPHRWWVKREADCARATLPKASDALPSDAAPDLAYPIYFALHDLRIGEGETWRDIGFDLDGSCKNDGADGVSCSNADLTPSADEGRGCRDNAIGQMLIFAKGVVPQLTESRINCELKLGGYNILIRLSEYNGLRDDSQVRIDVYASVGWTTRYSDCDAETMDYSGINFKLPEHGPDWLIMPESEAARGSACEAQKDEDGLAGGKVCATDAYVRGGYLVAHVGQAEFWLNGVRAANPGFRMPLQQAALVGFVRRDETALDESKGWKLDATLGGITDVTSMLDGFATLGVCEETCRDDPENDRGGGYSATATALSGRRDMAAGTGNSGGACDALSVGWQFAAAQTAGKFFVAPPYDMRTSKSWELSELCGVFTNPVAVCAADETSPQPVSTR